MNPKYKFKFSQSELKLLIGNHVGSGDYQWYPCSLDEAMGFMVEFVRELRKMAHMFGKADLKYGVNLFSFKATPDGRVAFSTHLGKLRVEREVSASQATRAWFKLKGAIDEAKG